MRTTLILLSLCVGATGLSAESAAGVKWTAPAGWTTQAPRPMRAATYAIDPVSGDKTAAECAVYFFGPGQGGTVDANIARWKGQFTGQGGAPAPANVATRKVRGLAMTTIDVAGNYSGIAGPTASAPQTVAGYRLLGAIVEGPGGNVFIKFTGPTKTVAANQQKFEQLLASFQPDK
jgi:hypothetical protein